MGTSFFAFVVVLGVLIFFHELGHFLVARFFGVGVEKFSLGFGPRILGKTIGMTEYRLSAIPLGGYVKMVGEDPDADVRPDQKAVSFTHQHVYKRICIVAAGPLFNMLLAVFIFFGIFFISGTYLVKPTVGSVQEGTPAFQAGMQSGDEIVAIDGRKIAGWDEMAAIIADSDGQSLGFSVLREGAVQLLTVMPRKQKVPNIFGEEVDRYVIGISAAGDVEAVELGLFAAMGQSLVQTYRITHLTVVSVVKLIEGTVSVKTLGGPIMIADMAGQQAREGVVNLLFFIALISINLAILNMLPIPVLDGGHLLFFFIEVLLRRPVSLRLREISQQVGLFLLLMLMILVFYNDITRYFR
jgi:regulator of sigma E protease